VKFLKEAKDKGFKIYLYFVCTKDPEINKARVINRVAKGGHNVPPVKITDRYYSSLAVLANLIPYTYRCFLFDNSEEGNEDEINLVAEIEKGEKLTIRSEDVPSWVQEHVLDKIFQ
jgi:predicted ABC-type ATPase